METGSCGLSIFGLTALSFVLISPVSAQVAPAEGETPQLSASGAELGEVIVTARRLEERAQDVPVSMTVLNQRQLTDRNIITAGDLAAYTPSLSVDNQFGEDVTSFSIRGFTQAIQTTPSVAVYFADAVVPRGGNSGEPAGSGVAPGAFFDLQNVQVLKGPQGTLFGRNTTGGAVLLVPQKPTADFTGYVEGSYGNFGMEQVQAVLNVPFGERLRVRLGVNQQTRDGYLYNISGIGPRDFNDIGFTAARLSAVLDITPNVENYLVGSYSLSTNHGPIPHLFTCNLAVGVGGLLCPGQLAKQQPANPNAVQNDMPGASSYLRQLQFVDTTSWRANDNLTIKNVLNYGELRTSLVSDIFGTAFVMPGTLPFPTPGGVIQVPDPFAGARIATNSSDAPSLGSGAKITDQYTFSDELQFQGSTPNDKLTWQAGGYLEISGPLGGLTGSRSVANISCTNVAALQCTDVLGALQSAAAGTLVTVGQVLNATETIVYHDAAAYAQGTYALTDQLKITGGLRYTSDLSSATSHAFVYQFPQPNTPVNAYCVVTLATEPSCQARFYQKSDAPTWLIDLEYKPIDTTMLYAKYTRGYRQGSVDTTAPAYNVFRPERLNSYEIGEKSSFHGPVTGTFNVTAFYNDFTDQQLLFGIVNPLTGLASSDIFNAGKSRIAGVEVESTVTPVRPLSFGVSYAYLSTLLKSATVPQVAGYAIFPTSVPGSPLTFSPKNKLSANATYTLPVPDSVGAVSLGATYTYTSRDFVSAATPFGSLPGYSLLDMNLHWGSIAGSHVDLELFATNVTDKRYYTNVTGFYNTFGFETHYIGEPRMYGARVRLHFGN